MFKLNRSQFAYIAYCAQFMASQDIRFYLNGMRFKSVKDSTELRITATDGHTLADAKINLDESAKADMEFILNKDDVASLLSMASKIKSDFEAEFDCSIEGSISVSINGNQVIFKAVSGKYPDVDRVIPADDRECKLEGCIGINADYIARVSKGVKAAKRYNRSVNPYMTLNINGQASAIIIMIRGFGGVKTILMPMRL